MKSYKMKINGEKYKAKIVSYDGTNAKVNVNGVDFLIEIETEASQSTPTLVRSQKSAPAVPEISHPTNISSGTVRAPIPGTILSVNTKEGDDVRAGDIILTLEAMKMESEITAPVDGKVKKIHIDKGDNVQESQILVEIEPSKKYQEAAKAKHVSPSPRKSKKQPASQPVAPKSGQIVAPIPGTVLDVKVRIGDTIKVDDTVVILEAMKMESDITSDYAGKVTDIKVQKGDSVQEHQVLIEIGE